jgi:hypothetical protein
MDIYEMQNNGSVDAEEAGVRCWSSVVNTKPSSPPLVVSQSEVRDLFAESGNEEPASEGVADADLMRDRDGHFSPHCMKKVWTLINGASAKFGNGSCCSTEIVIVVLQERPSRRTFLSDMDFGINTP